MRNAELSVPVDFEIVNFKCTVDYDNLELGEKKTLFLYELDMGDNNLQDIFNILTLEGEEQPHEIVKKFCNLKVGEETFILSGCIVDVFFKNRIKLFCDKILLNEE